MRIRMSESLATVNGNMTAGREYDVDAKEAGRLIKGGIAVAASDADLASASVPTGETSARPDPEANKPDMSAGEQAVVPPTVLPSSLPTGVTPNAGGVPVLSEPERPTTLPDSRDPEHTAEREQQTAEDADPVLYGHKLSVLAAKTDDELIDMPLIGKAAVKKIREAQAEREKAVADAKAKKTSTATTAAIAAAKKN